MALDEVLSAAADGTRRAVLQRLAHGPATVGQLAALFPISRPAVSQHLRVLREAGLVRPVGTSRTSPYELVPGPLFLVESWARDVADRWSAAPTDRPDAVPTHADRNDADPGEAMTQPVTYLEISSPDLASSSAFFEGAFGWRLQPFAAPDYLVAPGDDRGIDTALLASRDGAPRAVPVIRVPSLGTATARVREHGGTVVVEPFSIAGVGRGCYVLDPAGVLLGLHEYDPEAG